MDPHLILLVSNGPGKRESVIKWLWEHCSEEIDEIKMLWTLTIRFKRKSAAKSYDQGVIYHF